MLLDGAPSALAAAVLLAAAALPATIGDSQPIVVKTVSFRPPVIKIQDRIPLDKEGQTALPERVSLGWPRVLPRENNEPSATEAWASASPTERYLCEVYHRIPEKRDRSGDFTWKDRIAAEKAGKGLCEYTIGGMNPDFKEKLALIGRRLDSDGFKWSILSGFRDDYRQGIAKGFKARVGNSLHGGSRATRGYGDGRAIDITVDPLSALGEVFKVIDTFGREVGLVRPMPRYDAAHIQAGGGGNKKRIVKNKKRQSVASNKGMRNESGGSYASPFAE
jgi:hypothetical protein